MYLLNVTFTYYYLHCGFRFNKDEVMEIDFQAYLASSDEDAAMTKDGLPQERGIIILLKRKKLPITE